MPFLIEDLTSRSLRVPDGPPAEHPNGATGISRLEIVMPDPKAAARSFAALSGAGASLRLGTCELSLVAPEQDEARRRLDAVGPGPLAVELASEVPGSVEELDRRISRGISIRLLRRRSL